MMPDTMLDREIAAALARDLATYGPREALTAGNATALRADFFRRRLTRGLIGGPAMRMSRDFEARLPLAKRAYVTPSSNWVMAGNSSSREPLGGAGTSENQTTPSPSVSATNTHAPTTSGYEHETSPMVP